MKTEIYQYNESPITFQLADGDVMVSATAMAKPFDKRPAKWLELPSTKEFLDTLKAIRKSDRLIVTINGKGTWFHSDVALEFARWLSPHFAVWCNDRIKELLKTGVTTASNDDEMILHAMQVLQSRLTDSQSKTKQLEEQSRLQSEQLSELKPKADYYDTVLMSESTYTARPIAQELGMTAQRFNNMLHEMRIQYKQGKRWVLYSKYQGQGYTNSRTCFINPGGHRVWTETSTVWTEKGRAWLHSLFTPKQEEQCGN